MKETTKKGLLSFYFQLQTLVLFVLAILYAATVITLTVALIVGVSAFCLPFLIMGIVHFVRLQP